MYELARFIILVGFIMVILGLLLLWHPFFPWLGNLPGDIVIRRNNFTFYFPLGTSIVISLVLSLIFWLRS